MIPLDKVREIMKKHEILEKELSSGTIEKKLFASKSKEYSELNAVINYARDYLTFDKSRDDLKPLSYRAETISASSLTLLYVSLDSSYCSKASTVEKYNFAS